MSTELKSNEPCRCSWVDLSKPDYVTYHDTEWGVPVHDDNKLFEFLTLEAAQAGLSWYTVLKKRDNYRAAFANFDPVQVAAFDDARAAELLQNPGIIRNRLKIAAAINNAARFLEVQAEFGSFSNYQWQFVGGKPQQNSIASPADFRATSPESDAFSKDLKKRGFKFVGSTIIYAHMQACGMVNDHHQDCFRNAELINLLTRA
ncbi:DNA-3-methyladenine glycosylase I [Arsukibacterium indicum]|uniref:DNA-3-methyladenine glycosylase I n=1 Tax=Arsukibacterium indicum TaxID=2848612 RepID=A0ABS6MPR0_9GAMM|nr:DNA-3-methyladenine glycosylase I [Arsukibacterium indicum]MBV2130792.1 DNA-3-methyladenine glycosylase I [Arsukibacterium indicum]